MNGTRETENILKCTLLLELLSLSVTKQELPGIIATCNEGRAPSSWMFSATLLTHVHIILRLICCGYVFIIYRANYRVVQSV
jgi:hypothetical protein